MEAPRMTPHARIRAHEMGVTYQQICTIVMERTVTYASNRGHSNNGLIVQSAREPGIAVVWDPTTNCVLTVLHRTQETYVRPEKMEGS